MPDPASYPMDSRPAGYRGGVAEMLSRIRGASRRHQVEAAVRAGRLRQVPAALLGETAPEDSYEAYLALYRKSAIDHMSIREFFTELSAARCEHQLEPEEGSVEEGERHEEPSGGRRS